MTILVGTAMVLAKLPHDKIPDGLKELCSPQVTPLTKVRMKNKGSEILVGGVHNVLKSSILSVTWISGYTRPDVSWSFSLNFMLIEITIV